MLKGVEDVCIIDSFVVDKANFLSAYKISEESGKLFMFNEFSRLKEIIREQFMKQKSEIKSIIVKREKEEIWTFSPKTNC